MAKDLYWVTTLTYAITLLIILINDVRAKKFPTKAEEAFWKMVSFVILFCIQDTFWGICEQNHIESDTAFFVASEIFHICTVIPTLLWLNYVLIYVDAKPKMRQLYLALNSAIIIFEVVLCITNIYEPVLFTIEDGVYITESWRPATFLNQYLVFLLVGITTLMQAIKQKDTNSTKAERYRFVFFASLAPILLGIFQLLYPDAPFYSLGYFFACFIVRTLVVAKDRVEVEKANLFKSISQSYYSLHIIDLKNDKIERYIESDLLKKIIGNETSAQKMFYNVINTTCCKEYLEIMLEFANLSTLPDRMRSTNVITCEFVGKNYGWTRISLVPMEKEGDCLRRVMLTTQVIDAEKRKQIDLLFKTNNDELTALYNRRAFHNEIANIEKNGAEDNLVIASIDVNGLKIVNDTLGHAAGDELIIGAADCMKKCFSTYGKIYRTGGDEFYALIYADNNQLENIKHDFDDFVTSWKGKLVDSLAVSVGYIAQTEHKQSSIHDLIILADEKMYQNKAEFYSKKGVDRRGQKDAHIALCALYTKILKINLTEDSFQIIDLDPSEKEASKGFSNTFSGWTKSFGQSGLVHPDDLNHYYEQTDIEKMRKYFKDGKKSLSIFYRRKIGDKFKHVMLQIINASDYTDNNQSLFLYVKDIDK